MADPHFQARGTFQPIESTIAGRPLYYPVSLATDGSQPLTAFESGAPRLGEHTREVLTQLGISDAEIQLLAGAGAI
jgi:crotonobetainyl-CoA:carnitine CoA-transferase CaiB-like acyl-CoA transferase